MQTITNQQISNIAQSIVKLSKANTPLKHSSILEIISHTLGYKDYNGLSSVIAKDKSTPHPSIKPPKIDNSNDESEMDTVSTTVMHPIGMRE